MAWGPLRVPNMAELSRFNNSARCFSNSARCFSNWSSESDMVRARLFLGVY
jgi:hypothetical protein